MTQQRAPYVFLSGPMTGVKRWNRERFVSASDWLAKVRGWRVYSPSDRDADMGFDFNRMIGPNNPLDLQAAWRANIKELLEVDAIVFLPHWEQGTGSVFEAQAAYLLGLPAWACVMSGNDPTHLIEVDLTKHFSESPKQSQSGTKTQREIREYAASCVELVVRKNRDYNSSIFTSPVAAPGMTAWHAAWCRLSDKISRAWQLWSSGEAQVKDETLHDTLRDLVGYAILIGYGQKSGKFRNDD